MRVMNCLFPRVLSPGKCATVSLSIRQTEADHVQQSVSARQLQPVPGQNMLRKRAERYTRGLAEEVLSGI